VLKSKLTLVGKLNYVGKLSCKQERSHFVDIHGKPT